MHIKETDERLVIQESGITGRLVFGASLAVGIVLGAAFLSRLKNGAVHGTDWILGVAAIFLATIGILGVVGYASVMTIIDRKKQIITIRERSLFHPNNKEQSFDLRSIKSVRLRTYRGNSMHSSGMNNYVVVLARDDGQVFPLSHAESSARRRWARLGERVAAFLGVPFD